MMFDNLRDQINSAPFADDDAKLEAPPRTDSIPRRGSSGHFLGMTAQQRFFVTVILMIMVCLMGTMCLLVTGRIGLF
jgi:hypothetical protein